MMHDASPDDVTQLGNVCKETPKFRDHQGPLILTMSYRYSPLLVLQMTYYFPSKIQDN